MSLLKKIKQAIGADLFGEEKEKRENSSFRKITFEHNDKHKELENVKDEGEKEVEGEKVETKLQGLEENKEKTPKKTKPKANKSLLQKNQSLKKQGFDNNSHQDRMASEKQNKIFQSEGQLAIDLLQNDEEFIIQTALAGVKAEDLDILVEDDSVSIKGVRKRVESKKNDYEYVIQECYWGPFSREVILPEEIKIDDVEAVFKDGILTIRLPKLQRERRRKVFVEVRD